MVACSSQSGSAVRGQELRLCRYSAASGVSLYSSRPSTFSEMAALQRMVLSRGAGIAVPSAHGERTAESYGPGRARAWRCGMG